ncbi:MAG: acyl-ACP--UDP-N-acetylglucosamine O-acyltransferase [Acidobacteriota bacterium]|jgi:UDP-N-acetylglucosamine acyltransferase
MAIIDPAARVHPEARLADDVTVGMGAMIEADVVVGPGSVIAPHALLYSGTTIGERVQVGAGAAIGGTPQDLKFRGGASGVRVGDGTVIREYVTVHRCVEPGGVTVVGSECLLMATSHVAHECLLGDRVIVANGVMMAGHVVVGDGVFLSGNVVVHQFTSIGRLAMIGGGSAVRQDIVPFALADGHPARPKGLNVVGLRRAGMSEDTIRALKRAYRALFASGNRLEERLEKVKVGADGCVEVAELLRFMRASDRGVARPRPTGRAR